MYKFYWLLSLVFLVYGCTSTHEILGRKIVENCNLPEDQNLPDPGINGRFNPGYSLYASGNNLRRNEYNCSNVKITSTTVDLSTYIEKLDTDHWGFDVTDIPVNGKIWYPKDTNNSCPMCVIVHGNNYPYISSEFGFDYIGEHLASRGVITVLIDANFLNGKKLKLREEANAKAILVLEHLKQIMNWNKSPDNLLYKKVDPGNILLIGHSTGGNVILLASLFNSMDRYPGNGMHPLYYNFNINSLVFLAPEFESNIQAYRTSVFKGRNILILSGLHDGQVTNDNTVGFFNQFYPGNNCFISNIWVLGANHNQFNSLWAKNQDNSPTLRHYLLSVKEQQCLTKTIVSAFCDSTFNSSSQYKEFFKDYRQGLSWLPLTLFISQYKDSQSMIIADFEGDTEFNIVSIDGWQCRISGFHEWKEVRVPLNFPLNVLSFESIIDKLAGIKQFNENWGMYLDWNHSSRSSKTPPEFTFFANGKGIEGNSLVFDLAVIAGIEPDEIFDFTIEVIVETGENFSLDFYDVYKLLPLPDVWIFSQITKKIVFQTIFIEFNKFFYWKENYKITGISFIFNPENSGKIFLDNIRIQ